MNQELFEPIELIEPLSLIADMQKEGPIIISCRGPGYICKVGQAET